MKKLALIIPAVLLVLVIFLELRPPPAVTPLIQLPAPAPTQAIALPWPSTGQAALGASGYGVLASHNSTTAVSIASIAKVITALAVLRQKPLAAGSQGPTITLDSTDVGFYNSYLQQGGSVAKVTAGEQLTEYQALQTMLLPSANNMADSLARWAFGSVSTYVTYANKMVKSMGLDQTAVGDSNGFSDATTSTAGDLVELGLAALNDPVVAQITSQTTAQVPVAGEIENTDFMLGEDGIVGIKTGNTTKAGGCYLFAAKRTIGTHQITLVGAILGAPQLNIAETAADPLIKAADSGFQQVPVVAYGQALGYYQPKWGSIVPITAAKQLGLFAWKGANIKITSRPAVLSGPHPAGTSVGTVTIQSGQQTVSSPLVLERKLAGPSIWWRLVHW